MATARSSSLPSDQSSHFRDNDTVPETNASTWLGLFAGICYSALHFAVTLRGVASHGASGRSKLRAPLRTYGTEASRNYKRAKWEGIETHVRSDVDQPRDESHREWEHAKQKAQRHAE